MFVSGDWDSASQRSVYCQVVAAAVNDYAKLLDLWEAAKPFGTLGMDVPDDAIIKLHLALTALEQKQ